MNIYIYTKSGHNIGLDAVRRGAVLYKQLEKCEPILCTSDYRAATFARDLGAYKGLGIDVIENLPNVMERGDMLIFDSDEPNETMLEFMNSYCTHIYKVGIDISKTIVDDMFFKKGNQSIEKTFFFGDDDYQDNLLKLCDSYKKQDISLLMGHYYFLGNEDKLKSFFNNIIEEEEYFETVLNTKYLLTSSVNSVFESLAAGNFPIFYKRTDKANEDIELIEKYDIPIISGNKLEDIINKFEETICNYPKIKSLEKVDTKDIKNTIFETMEKFKAIKPSLEINY